MSAKLNRFRFESLPCLTGLIVAGLLVTGFVGCSSRRDEPVSMAIPGGPAGSALQSEPSGGDQSQDYLVHWMSYSGSSNPSLASDFYAWMNKNGIRLPDAEIEQGHGGERIDVSPSPEFGTAVIRIIPPAASGTGDPREVSCHSLSVHSTLNARVFVGGDSTEPAAVVNIDSGRDYVILPHKISIESTVSVTFPGNAAWESFYRSATLGEWLKGGKDDADSACDLFVLGSSDRNELTKRGEPDKAAVPGLLSLLSGAPSKHTRAMAATYLGIIGDKSALEPMINAMESEKDAWARASIALGLGIMGDPAAIAAVQKAAESTREHEELAWMFVESINRLNGIRR
ncbi:MAG TPA: HEAT repeat domain-containing protein [Myxococcota bacterium]|nr:HEAT repeat domain-containing protein [Myxococcota bacterium]